MRYKKILLINPPLTQDQVYGLYALGAPALPPLGLCAIAAVLIGQGREVQLMDCAAEKASLADIRTRVEEFSPQAVGVTFTTVSFHPAQKVLALVKGVDPGILTLGGGAHISALPRQTLEECPDLDIGIYGEGELTVQELLRTLDEGGCLGALRGICRRQDGAVVVNPPRPAAPDLDVFPHPARHLLKDLAAYRPNPFRGGGRAVSIISSRGCPCACGYCGQSVFGRHWRGHSADYVLREIKSLVETHGFEFFSFEDDNFTISARRTAELCRGILREKLGIGWTCSARVNSLTPELLDLMREAGCKTIFLGIETGSARLLEMIDKGLTVEDSRRGVELCVKHGLKPYGAFMIGLPTQTPEEIDQTIEFALSLPLDAVSCFLYVPYPATPLRRLALQHGAVSGDWRDYCAHPRRLPFLPAGMTQDYLLAKQREFYRRFYLRPGHVLSHLANYLRLARP